MFSFSLARSWFVSYLSDRTADGFGGGRLFLALDSDIFLSIEGSTFFGFDSTFYPS